MSTVAAVPAMPAEVIAMLPREYAPATTGEVLLWHGNLIGMVVPAGGIALFATLARRALIAGDAVLAVFVDRNDALMASNHIARFEDVTWALGKLLTGTAEGRPQ